MKKEKRGRVRGIVSSKGAGGGRWDREGVQDLTAICHGAGTREGDGLQEPISSSAHQVSHPQHLYDQLGQAGEDESLPDQAET